MFKFFGITQDGTKVPVTPTIQEDGSMAIKDAGYIRIDVEEENV